LFHDSLGFSDSLGGEWLVDEVEVLHEFLELGIVDDVFKVGVGGGECELGSLIGATIGGEGVMGGLFLLVV